MGETEGDNQQVSHFDNKRGGRYKSVGRREGEREGGRMERKEVSPESRAVCKCGRLLPRGLLSSPHLPPPPSSPASPEKQLTKKWWWNISPRGCGCLFNRLNLLITVSITVWRRRRSGWGREGDGGGKWGWQWKEFHADDTWGCCNKLSFYLRDLSRVNNPGSSRSCRSANDGPPPAATHQHVLLIGTKNETWGKQVKNVQNKHSTQHVAPPHPHPPTRLYSN